MSHRSVPLELAPPRLLVDGHEIGTAGIIVQAHGASPTSLCPACGLASSVHSRYERTPVDFPAHGRRLRIPSVPTIVGASDAVCVEQVTYYPGMLGMWHVWVRFPDIVDPPSVSAH